MHVPSFLPVYQRIVMSDLSVIRASWGWQTSHTAVEPSPKFLWGPVKRYTAHRVFKSHIIPLTEVTERQRDKEPKSLDTLLEKPSLITSNVRADYFMSGYYIWFFRDKCDSSRMHPIWGFASSWVSVSILGVQDTHILSSAAQISYTSFYSQVRVTHLMHYALKRFQQTPRSTLSTHSIGS